jgi:hypothetical protein
VDDKSKLIEEFQVSAAHTHDSQALEDLLDKERDQGQRLSRSSSIRADQGGGHGQLLAQERVSEQTPYRRTESHEYPKVKKASRGGTYIRHDPELNVWTDDSQYLSIPGRGSDRLDQLSLQFEAGNILERTTGDQCVYLRKQG